MKIVEIPSFFPPYGGEFCLEQSKALASLGHDVTILANVQLAVRRGLRPYLFTPYIRRWITLDGIRIYRSDMRGFPLCIRPNVMRWIHIVRSMFKTYMRIYGKPDIIHAHCVKWAGYASYLISKEYGIPFVITEHLPSMIYAGEFGDDINNAWQIPLLKEAYHYADMVIPVSSELVTDLKPYFGVDYRWTSISNTIDTDFFAYRKRTVLAGRNFRFCCLANFVRRKGYDILLKAFDILAEKYNNVELYIAGKYTDGDDLKLMVNRIRNKKKIFICGELDKVGVRNLLYHCDCLALATRNEAQGLVLLEAMSTGIPAISTNIIPNNARIEKGTFIVPVDNVQAFSNCMERIMLEYDIDGKELSETVRRNVSSTVIGKKIVEVFTKVISSHSEVTA